MRLNSKHSRMLKDFADHMNMSMEEALVFCIEQQAAKRQGMIGSYPWSTPTTSASSGDITVTYNLTPTHDELELTRATNRAIAKGLGNRAV